MNQPRAAQLFWVGVFRISLAPAQKGKRNLRISINISLHVCLCAVAVFVGLDNKTSSLLPFWPLFTHAAPTGRHWSSQHYTLCIWNAWKAACSALSNKTSARAWANKLLKPNLIEEPFKPGAKNQTRTRCWHVCLLKNTEYLLYEFNNVYPAGSQVRYVSATCF
jgi:hypothetical protein